MPPPRRIGSNARPSIPATIVERPLHVDDLVDDAAFAELSLSAREPLRVHASRVQFAGARLTKLDFAESRLSHLDAADAEFAECNLSNVRAEHATFRRVLFSQNKLTGIHVSASTFFDVEFAHCRLELASFEKVTFKHVTFRGCRIRESDFSATVFDRVRFVDCDLSRATFTRIRGEHSEMRRSILTGLKGIAQLRGIAMEPNDILAGAELFAAELGIGIATVPDPTDG